VSVISPFIQFVCLLHILYVTCRYRQFLKVWSLPSIISPQSSIKSKHNFNRITCCAFKQSSRTSFRSCVIQKNVMPVQHAHFTTEGTSAHTNDSFKQFKFCFLHCYALQMPWMILIVCNIYPTALHDTKCFCTIILPSITV